VETPDKAGIMGVYSRSEEAPIKTGNFNAAEASFDDAENYTKWTFIYSPQELAKPQLANTAR